MALVFFTYVKLHGQISMRVLTNLGRLVFSFLGRRRSALTAEKRDRVTAFPLGEEGTLLARHPEPAQ